MHIHTYMYGALIKYIYHKTGIGVFHGHHLHHQLDGVCELYFTVNLAYMQYWVYICPLS